MGKWIDGNSIYAKTLHFNVNKTGNFAVSHNIQNIGGFRSIDWTRSFFIRSSDGVYCPFPSIVAVSGGESFFAGVPFITDTQIILQSGNSSIGDYTVTINYTKKIIN